ncbi:hypothetical protein ACFVDQ_42670 [Streptomyces sp. NPDC057684]|uniref:hypothetical protein n=1 Tax=unclassified Streptomyces TaxID=2593676 RepID=UPI0036872A67
MSAKRKTLQGHVEIPGVCFTRKPEGVLRRTLSAGHYGEHRHFYSGALRNGARRHELAASAWRRRPTEDSRRRVLVGDRRRGRAADLHDVAQVDVEAGEDDRPRSRTASKSVVLSQ